MPIGAFRLNSLSAAVAAAVSNSITATGGTITRVPISGTVYKVHTFTTTGNNSFVVSAVTGTPTANILLVGGGGAGGGTSSTPGAGGGGGGGAVSYQTGVSVTAQTYTVAVGTGGTGNAGAAGNAGVASTGLGFTANGGGGGTINLAATNGAGSGANTSTSYTSTAGTYAYKGGNSFGSGTTTSRAGGGGAGAGAVGTNASSTVGGTGGAGVQNNIDGNNYYYGSGGGGGGTTAGNAWNRGGGSVTSGSGFGRGAAVGGDLVDADGATAQYGGGGGGARNTSSAIYAGGNAKQGIVIISYPIGSQVTSIAYLTTAYASATTISMPTIQAGDLAIFFDWARNSTTTIPTTAIPSGFTSIAEVSQATTNGVKAAVSYKILDGTESGTTLTGMNATILPKQILIYRPTGVISSVTVNGLNQQATASAPTNQTLDLGTYNTALDIGFAQYCSSGTVTTRGSTVTETREVGSAVYTKIKTFEGGGFSSSTISQADYGVNALQSFILRIA